MNLMQTEETVKKAPTSSAYRTIWRWHFYAGIIFAPFLVMLAVTGSIYLFKPQIENVLYQSYMKSYRKQIVSLRQNSVSYLNHYRSK